MYKFTYILVLLSLIFGGTHSVYAEETKSLSVTVYNHGQALINEVRALKIPKGESKIEFADVAQTIVPETLQVKSLSNADAFSVLDMNYEYDLISVRNILNKYVGKELTIVIPDKKDAEESIVTEAILLANNDRPVF